MLMLISIRFMKMLFFLILVPISNICLQIDFFHYDANIYSSVNKFVFIINAELKYE